MEVPRQPADFTCSVKYLGSQNAMYPQTGTLENIARVYQKGCALNERDIEKLTVTKDSVSVRSKNTEKIFKLRKILFCASYKKIPKVVAFNYMVSSSPKRLECHAFLCGSNEEARAVVAALTSAFRMAYNESKNAGEIHVDETITNHKIWTVDSAEEKEIKVIFALPRKIGEIFDTLTNCMTAKWLTWGTWGKNWWGRQKLMPGDVWKVLIYAMGCARRSYMDKYLTKETFFFDYLKTWSLVSKLITILGGQLQQFIEHKLET